MYQAGTKRMVKSSMLIGLIISGHLNF